MPTVAIDYDGTLKRSSTFDASESKMWETIVKAFLRNGWVVIISTAREGTKEDREEITRYQRTLFHARLLEVVFCGSISKREACREAGFEVDLWIDDMPESIGTVKIIGGGLA